MHNTGSPDEAAMTAAVVVRLPMQLREALRQKAVAEDRTVASILRLAARAYLDNTAQGQP